MPKRAIHPMVPCRPSGQTINMMKTPLLRSAVYLVLLQFIAANSAVAGAIRHGSDPSGEDGPPYSSGPVSADGRYVVFSSNSDSLVANDNNGKEDVFRYDRQTGNVLLVSLNQDNTGSGDFASFSPVINADGTVVAFVSDATNVSDQDHNGLTDVFVRDLTAGVTALVSANPSGTNSGNGRSFRPQISADGRIVAFESEATDLVAIPDANGESDDVFARDRTTGVTRLVSVNASGTASGDRASLLGAISADGRIVVFESAASDLALTGGDTIRNVFARDLTNGVTTLVSVNQTGTGGGDADSFGPIVSANGALVAFGSSASNLAPDDKNGRSDIFVRDLASGVTELASVNLNSSGSANGDSFGPRLSADGRILAFNSSADDLAVGDTNGSVDVFVRDRAVRVTALVSGNLARTGSANGAADGVALSANGKIVAFVSTASDLTADPVDGLPNLFVRDLATGVTSLASKSRSGGGSGSDPAVFLDPAISGNGGVLAFHSTATDLIAESVNGSGAVFLYGLENWLPRLGHNLQPPMTDAD
jgi:Tol biopolymer transport system component